jgi:PAS domain S-box-containing protein
MPDDDFAERYAEALGRYLNEGDEASLATGHELGRSALQGRLGVLEVVEGHFRVVEESTASHAKALPFLLQALATFDVATAGYLDGTTRYQQQRARADDLEDRDAFRSALVNSLQEGFFVVDHEGTLVEVNEAFAAITGYGSDSLPFRWPYPWLVDRDDAGHRLAQLVREGSLQSETPIRHPDGRVSWAVVSINSVTEEGDDRGAYVGTIRDVTAERFAEVRRSAVVRLATALSVATSVTEVLDVLLNVVASAIDVRRVVAAIWNQAGANPTVRVAGSPPAVAWGDLEPGLREALAGARGWSQLTVEAVSTSGGPEGEGGSHGMMTALSGVDDTVLWLEYPERRVTSDEDRILVAALIGHLSLAVQHVRQFETAREASLTLQRTMMPTTKPPIGFAVRYEPAVSPLEIGGDWYDVLAIGDHQIGVIVGDCVGSGLSAAAVMGQLRSSARVLLINGVAPARLLDELDSAAELIPGAYCATVFVCTIDTDTGEMTYSSAGHVPALLAVSGATAEMLTGATSVPLAVQKTGPRREASKSLPPDSTLMLYTDGLVERRVGLIDNGIQRAGEVLVEMIESPAEAVADAVLSRLTPQDGFDDDVAIVVYRRPPAPLEIEVTATPDQLSDIRSQLGSWLRATGIPDDLAGDIVLVVNEACTNSIEHGYRGKAPGRMLVFVEAKGRGICIRITDFGSWKLPDANPRVRGRGVPLMRAVSGDVTLAGTSTGTVVTMNFEL